MVRVLLILNERGAERQRERRGVCIIEGERGKEKQRGIEK